MVRKSSSESFEKFSIKYDSSSGDFKNHKIDAADLGKAILAVTTIVSEANALTSKGKPYELMVTAPAREGSVIVDFLVAATSPETLDALRYIGFSAVAGSIVGGNLVEFVKKISDKSVTDVVVDKEGDLAKVTVDGKKVSCNKFVALLATNKKVRDSLHSVIQAPISGKEDAVFKILDEDEHPLVVIPEDDSHKFTPPSEGFMEKLEVETELITGNFLRVNFDGSQGWRLRRPDGREHQVELADEKFLRKVSSNRQAFSKEDLFELKIEKEAKIRTGGRDTFSYRVVEVTRHFARKNRRLV